MVCFPWEPGPVPDAVRRHNGDQFIRDAFDENLSLMPCREIIWILGAPVQACGDIPISGLSLAAVYAGARVRQHFPKKSWALLKRTFLALLAIFRRNVLLAYELQNGLRGV